MWTVVTILVVSGVLVLAAAHRLPQPQRRHPLTGYSAAVLAGAGGTALTLGVLLSWAARPLSIPVTMLAIVVLLLARRAAPHWYVVQVPVIVFALAVTVSAGLHLAGTPLSMALWVTALISTVVLVGLSSAGPRTGLAEQSLLTGLGAFSWLIGLSLGSAVPLRGEYAWLVVSLVALAGTGLLARDPRSRWAVPVRAVALALSVLACAAVVVRLQVLVASWVPGLVVPSGLLITVVGSAVALTVAGLRWQGTDRPAVFLQAAQGAAGLLMLISLPVNLDQALLWLTLLIQAVTLAVTSLLPGYARLGWLALLLGSASLWERAARHGAGAAAHCGAGFGRGPGAGGHRHRLGLAVGRCRGTGRSTARNQ